ncbi:hypothetical protein DFH08DRAFT_841507 [Mycena albidolilacea]|uniref:Uncharacterized protein n=1 Tax=Mycena albidolilacea TaxID=1033008 RepID=A0AAD7AM41_9AGAR|nr:hypothetical protein DFH08DRAFT_841507 [Mycena albidolilacea]
MLYFHSLLLFAAVVRSFPTASPVEGPSEEMIPVPGAGWRPKSSVHEIPHGGQVITVGDEFHLLDAGGRVLHTMPTGAPSLKDPSHNISARTTKYTEGWVTTAVWDGTPSQPISSSKATWTVPSAPQTNWGFQILYYFNGIGADGVIFQPVLQFTFSWTVASWLVGPTGVFVTQSVPVKPGQVLNGVMTQTKKSATSWTLTSSFTGIANTTLSMTYASPMYIGWASAFEQYGVRMNHLDYPADTSMTFSNIELKFIGTAPTVAYRVINYLPAQGTTTITTNGGAAAKTVMHFPAPPVKLMTYCEWYNFTVACDSVSYPTAASVPLATAAIQCKTIDEQVFLPGTGGPGISAVNVTVGYNCFLYQNANCTGSKLKVDKSYPDLRLVSFDDTARAWSCNKA